MDQIISAEQDQKPDYKEIFDSIIESLNESQLNELIEEINNQKLLLKVKAEKRAKMKKELRDEKARIMREMKEAAAKQLKAKMDDSDSESDKAPRKKRSSR